MVERNICYIVGDTEVGCPHVSKGLLCFWNRKVFSCTSSFSSDGGCTERLRTLMVIVNAYSSRNCEELVLSI